MVDFFKQKNSKYHWRMRDVFYVLILYFVIFTLFLFIETKVFGKEVLEETGLNAVALFLEDIIEAIILTALPIFYVSRLYESNLEKIGITLKNIKRNFWLGMIVGLVLWVLASFCAWPIKIFYSGGPIHPYIEKLKIADNFIRYFAVFISITFIGPISEEIYLRGFAYTIFKERYGKSIAIILSSLLFCALHFNLFWAIPIFVMGIGLALLFESTGSLVSVIVAHSFSNVLSIFLGKL